MFVFENPSIYWLIHLYQHWGTKLTPKGHTFISYEVQPFLPSIYSNNSDSTAFPPIRSKAFFPVSMYYAWTNESLDEDIHKAARSSAKALFNFAQSEGQALHDVPLHPNYAILNTPLEAMYGRNLPKLKSLQSKVFSVQGLRPAECYGACGWLEILKLPFLFRCASWLCSDISTWIYVTPCTRFLFVYCFSVSYHNYLYTCLNRTINYLGVTSLCAVCRKNDLIP